MKTTKVYVRKTIPHHVASHVCEYGTVYILGGPLRSGQRAELYVSKDDGSHHYEQSFAMSEKDVSPRHDRGGYDSRCSCCYLGFSHTVDVHQDRLKRQSPSRQAWSGRKPR